MKKIALSTLTVLALSVSASAATQFYTNQATGQVFTEPGQGRVAVKNIASSSIFKKLKFGGELYIGYINQVRRSFQGQDESPYNLSEFQLRRGYLTVKAFMFPNPKDYVRVTTDISSSTGDKTFRVKYAYLYLADILPHTGVEIGQGHRPWHDYAEHNSWLFRAISKTFFEAHNGANLGNSADLGINFKTQTKYVTAQYGLYNGEGYHSADTVSYKIRDKSGYHTYVTGAGTGMSIEGRITAHLLGVNGKDKKRTYLNVSYMGEYNARKYRPGGVGTPYQNEVLNFVHAVFNTAPFLIAGGYYSSIANFSGSGTVTDATSLAGQGFSVNTEGRFGDNYQFDAFARYDYWQPKTQNYSDSQTARRQYIYGLAWHQNSKITWYANVKTVDDQRKSCLASYNGNQYMITARVFF